MGGSGSKPEQEHVFNADAPVRFSHSVLESLQRNPQTDSTRAHDLELKIQSRVNSELRRLRDSQAAKLSSLTDSLTVKPPPPEAAKSPESQRDPNTLVAHLSSPFYHDSTTPAAGKEEAADSGRSHDTVNSEVMELRKKLDGRKKVEQVPQAVEHARDEVVRCLRRNDRRPLDCWQEVEAFKVEVGKLEAAFIQKTGR